MSRPIAVCCWPILPTCPLTAAVAHWLQIDVAKQCVLESIPLFIDAHHDIPGSICQLSVSAATDDGTTHTNNGKSLLRVAYSGNVLLWDYYGF